jgi:branched-chain amino acid transport system substrate-binding protein
MKQNLKVLSCVLAMVTSACSTIGGQPAQTSGPIKIGMVTSLTGNFAPLGSNNKLAVQQVFDAVNAQGGVGGRTFELSALDDGSDPNQTVVQFNKLLDDGAVAVIGTPQTTANLAIKPRANERKIPTIALAAADSQVIPLAPYMWMTAPLSSQVAATCLASMQQHGLTRLAMLSDSSNGYAVAGHDAAKQALGQNGVILVADRELRTEPDQLRASVRENRGDQSGCRAGLGRRRTSGDYHQGVGQ